MDWKIEIDGIRSCVKVILQRKCLFKGPNFCENSFRQYETGFNSSSSDTCKGKYTY